MSFRGWLLAMLLLTASLGLGEAAVLRSPPVPEQLVEGHTVFVVIEQIDRTSVKIEHYAAAVAVLVREAIHERLTTAWPGVLWFNDQYLVDPDSTNFEGYKIRYPCSGAVLAVNQGDPFPYDAQWPSNSGAAYVESYHITDPNDHPWDIDKWNVTGLTSSYPLWTVALDGRDVTGATPDNGQDSCQPYEDECPGSSALATQVADGCGAYAAVPNSTVDIFASDPGTNGYHYPCGKPSACARILYNAVLFMKLDDLVKGGVPKDHRRNAPDRLNDVSGCQESAVGDYPCPSSDDDREGNSHPFRPQFPFRTAGGGNHGTSDPSHTSLVHATRYVDIAFGIRHLPLSRSYELFETEGSAAPFDAN